MIVLDERGLRGINAKAGTAKSSAPLSATRGGTKGEAKNSLPESVKTRRKEITTEAKETLRSQVFRHPKLDRDITLSGGGIDEWLNQPHKHYAEKNEMLLGIKSVLAKSEYLGTTWYKGKNSHIFETELCGEKTWIIVTDIAGKGLSVHSISDGEEILKDIKKPV